VLKYVGMTYMLYLAWKIARAKPASSGASEDSKPLSFWHMVLFQWVNPKAWMMAITSLSTYTVPTNYMFTSLVVVVTTIVMGFGSSLAWTGFGQALRGFLADPKWYRIVNITLAATLILSLLPMLWV
jgi:threonine/homoserine/homoserine lactone efflux protein